MPAWVLSKTEPLTEREFSMLMVHAHAGYDVLRDIEFPYPVAPIILQHHERINSSGYPLNLPGKDILLESKSWPCPTLSSDMAARLKDDTADSGFSIKNSSGTTTARFRGDVNVGIGTTTPQSALAVVGTVTISGNKLITSASSAINTFLGIDSGGTSTTGGYNTAIGNHALNNNTYGNRNTAIGYRTLYSNTTGYRNTVNGYNALYSNVTGHNNCASGYSALYTNTTGSYNTACGMRALNANSTGNSNTAVGYDAGYSTTGTGSVFLDYLAGRNETGSNKLYIANSDANTLIYGDFAGFKVGIGTTSAAMFTVGLGTPSVITGVGAGTAFITNTLEIGGEGYKPGGGSWASASDKRLKQHIAPLSGALDKITQLHGVTYEWVHPENHGHLSGTQTGLIAQDVETVFPEWVDEVDATGMDRELVPEGEKVKTLKFLHDFNAYIIEAIKELKTENDVLKTRLSALEEKMDIMQCANRIH